jgi:hypothetical protein
MNHGFFTNRLHEPSTLYVRAFNISLACVSVLQNQYHRRVSFPLSGMKNTGGFIESVTWVIKYNQCESRVESEQ